MALREVRTMEQHYIQVCDVEKYYGHGTAAAKAVDRVSFHVEKGEFVGVMGASGSGKTTLLNMLSTIDSVTAGHIYYENTDITELSENKLSEFRKNNLGFVFQEYNLLDTLTIEENIYLALSLHEREKQEIQNRCQEMLKLLGIEDIKGKFPYQVSGGQKQRCACARALVNRPKLLLADEPTGALDSRSAQTLLETFNNGADYLLVVSDRTAERMKPYYRLLLANLNGPAPGDLLRKLDALASPESITDFDGHLESPYMASGTDNIVVYVIQNVVRDITIPEVKFLLSSIIFALVYIGLVFVCVALTVLSVQQLSDSAKYRFRYQVLHQIGLSHREISRVILKQLAGFYLCPILLAAVISGTMAVYLGWKFNFHTGTHTAAAWYFGLAFLLFSSVYLIYFTVTYVGFLRNVLTKD